MTDLLGLEADELVVYEAVVDHPRACVRQLVELTGLSESHLRATLLALTERNLVEVAPGRPHTYSALDPGATLMPLLVGVERELQRVRDHVSDLTKRHRLSHDVRAPWDSIEVVTGRTEIRRSIAALEAGMSREMRSLDVPPYHDALDENDEELAFLAAGGSVKGVYDARGLEIPGRVPIISRWVEAGEQARVAPNVPMRLHLFDDDRAMFPAVVMPDGTPSPSWVIVYPSAVLAGLQHLFATVWDAAVPFSRYLVGDLASEGGLDPVDRRILSLLSAGISDHSIAKQLDISVRTLHRRLRGLMEHYRVETRFQLGVATARTPRRPSSRTRQE